MNFFTLNSTDYGKNHFTAYNYGSGQPIDMEKARSYVLVPEFYIGIVVSLLCVIIYLIYVHGKSF